MIRTVCLRSCWTALVSVLAIAKALRTPASYIAAGGRGRDLAYISAQDPLSKSDRLDLNNTRQEAPLPVVLQSIEPTSPAVTPPRPPVETKVVSRHWRYPNALSSRRTESKKKTRKVERKPHLAAERAKPSEPVKPCSRPGALGNLLRALICRPLAHDLCRRSFDLAASFRKSHVMEYRSAQPRLALPRSL